MFLFLDPGMEYFRSVACDNRDAGHAERFPGIDAFIDQVNGAACFRIPRVESLFPGMKSRILRQQAGMNVENSSRKLSQQRGTNDSHESGQDHEVDSGGAEAVTDFLEGGFA